jgi:hypothetical protein
MKAAVLSASAPLAMVGGIVLAQAAEDPIAQLRACSGMERAERIECLDKLSRAVAPPAAAATEGSRWVVSQTTSPVDYAPIATATTASRPGADGEVMQLSIRCRGGHTELTVAGPAISGPGYNYVVSYRINGGQPLQIPAATASFGSGIAFKSDVVALLQSLPSEGELAVHLSPRVGAAQEGVFSLAGLDAVRAKIAASCKWPHAIAKPNN